MIRQHSDDDLEIITSTEIRAFHLVLTTSTMLK